MVKKSQNLVNVVCEQPPKSGWNKIEIINSFCHDPVLVELQHVSHFSIIDEPHGIYYSMYLFYRSQKFKAIVTGLPEYMNFIVKNIS